MASKQENQDSRGALDQLVAGKATSHKNTDHEVVVILEDRLRLHLAEFQNILESQYEWKAPLDRSLTLLTTIIAVDRFRDVLSIPAAVWEAGLYIGLVISVVGLIKAGIRFFKNRSRSGTDKLIDRLKDISSDLETKESLWFVVKRMFLKTFRRRWF